MTRQLYSAIEHMRKAFSFDAGTVLEIGSANFNGTVRPLFADAQSYTGIDMIEGKDVDLVLNAHDIRKIYDKESFDTVVCCETLEHDDKFWISLQNMKDVLKPGGILIISTPTYGFPYHAYPNDYYRYSEDTYKDVFFKDMELLKLVTVMDDAGFPGLVGIGRKLLTSI